MTMGDHIKATRPAGLPDQATTPATSVGVEDTAVPAAPVDVVEAADAA